MSRDRRDEIEVPLFHAHLRCECVTFVPVDAVTIVAGPDARGWVVYRWRRSPTIVGAGTLRRGS